ncbi:MAG: hypothetical protein D5R99_08550 [Methanocalculus sp. MSAO_Arc1]|uniref:hypothetical protein n=1 Tax=Methanocalculus TaxID=71151 RepID=UPI000FF342CB|nr:MULTISPECIES: hypothetical protein [unclassified Methanocalculus]MCP1663150.1 hypothetical protein [Methanocalculus sp. AMF5]RQD79358.1 MAG: hypothetical protein D5R99_08550 [Methanocalculus sp. MSAO_Arc1]
MVSTKETPHFAELINRYWYLTPGVAIFGVVLSFFGITLPLPFIVEPGIWGCIISSFLLFGMAFADPKRDLVSMFTPLYAFIFFVVPSEFPQELPLMTLFTVTIIVLTARLQHRIRNI